MLGQSQAEHLFEIVEEDERSLELSFSQSTRSSYTSFEVIIERDLDKRVYWSEASASQAATLLGQSQSGNEGGNNP